jgi:hypothetical protein
VSGPSSSCSATAAGVKIVGPKAGKEGFLGSIAVRFMLDGSEAGERFSLVEAGPGDLVFKPRNQWHTFWNAGDEPCRILERFGLRMGEQLSGGWRAPVLDGTPDPGGVTTRQRSPVLAVNGTEEGSRCRRSM